MYPFSTASEAMSLGTDILNSSTGDVAVSIVCGGAGRFRVAAHPEAGRALLNPGESVSATMLRNGQLV